MKIRHSREPLPTVGWRTIPGAGTALLITDLKVSPRSRLRAKLLVFPDGRDLRRFWRLGLKKNDLGRYCVGAVCAPAMEVVNFDGPRETSYMEVDPRYFCLIGLCQTHLSMEVISHEAVHAGYAYAKRVWRRDMWPSARDLDEEMVCYPAGRIAAEINRKLRRARL